MSTVLKHQVQEAFERRYQKEVTKQVEFVIDCMTPKERDNWEAFLNHADTTQEEMDTVWDLWATEAERRTNKKSLMNKITIGVLIVISVALLAII